MLFNYATKEITLKVVYYGPGLGGKTTNLQQIHARLSPETRGKLLSLSTESDRTLFFDFLPMELGTIQGFRVRFQLYTVPGQVYYNATRKLVLKGADGVVFVADSQEAVRERNLESLQNLGENLQSNALDPDTMPMVLQFNKRDLPHIVATEEMDQELNEKGFPVFEAIATEGKGVVETFKAMARLLVHDLQGRVAVVPSETPAEAVPDAQVPVSPISLADALQEAAMPESPDQPEAVAVMNPDAGASKAETPLVEARVPTEDAQELMGEARVRDLIRVELASVEAQITQSTERLDRLEGSLGEGLDERLDAFKHSHEELSQNVQRLFQLMGETQGRNLAVQDELRGLLHKQESAVEALQTQAAQDELRAALQKQEQAIEELREQAGRSWFRARRTSL